MPIQGRHRGGGVVGPYIPYMNANELERREMRVAQKESC